MLPGDNFSFSCLCAPHSLSHDEETRKGPTINEFHNWGVGSKDVGMRHMDSVWALNRRGQRSADVIDGCPPIYSNALPHFRPYLQMPDVRGRLRRCAGDGGPRRIQGGNSIDI